MGKRKRRTDRNKTPPPSPSSLAFTSQSSQMESSLKEKSSHSFGPTGAKPTSSHMNNVERSHHAHHQSAAHHRHHNVNRSLSSRAPRHYYSIQHSHKNTANHSGTSTSHGKHTMRDDKHSWKFRHKPSESLLSLPPGRVIDISKMVSQREKEVSKMVIIDEVTCGVMNMRCRLCQKTTLDYSVVAVLVCGHVYHAECLEKRTRNADRTDPPCPLCKSSSSGVAN